MDAAKESVRNAAHAPSGRMRHASAPGVAWNRLAKTRSANGESSCGAVQSATRAVGRRRVSSAMAHNSAVGSIFEAAGGMDGLLRLAGAWHARVMADEVVSHAFSHGFHPEHTTRLAAYWAEALGGPTAYSDTYGDETSVIRMHSGNGEHDEMDRRAIACFDEALADVGLDADPRLRQALHDYFAWATTTTMREYHASADDVPDGLVMPHWSWDGLQINR
jgi:hemoglobin